MARRPCPVRQPDLTRTLKAVRVAGVEVERVEMDMQGPAPRRQRKPRKPSLARAIAEVRKAGETVRAVDIIPGGYKLTLGPQDAPAAAPDENPWDAEARKLRGPQ